MTRRGTHTRGAAGSAVPAGPIGGTNGPRAKTLRLEKSEAARRARAALGVSQETLALTLGHNRKRVRLWESEKSSRAPDLIDLITAPTPFARPLLERCGDHHDLDVSARPTEDEAFEGHVERISAVTKACANLSRALADVGPQGPSVQQLELFDREATTVIDVARRVRADARRELARRRKR